MNGDLIHIRRSKVGYVNQLLGEVTSPVLSLYGLYKLIPGI